MEKEIYKNIKGYEGLYEISNYGNIRNTRSGKILKPDILEGYKRVSLYIKNNKKNYFIHRLLGEHFIPNPENKKQINHIDGDKGNNDIKNLEWVTSSENVIHSCYTLKKRIKSVIQMDLNDKILNIYQSINEASRNTSICKSNIINTCKNKRNTAGGYKWKYII